jgi:hypothetical protein
MTKIDVNGSPSEMTSERVWELLEKATPGPWEFGPATNYEGHYIAPVGTMLTLGAIEQLSGRKVQVLYHNFPGQTKANAALIAAAPALALRVLAQAERIRELEEALWASQKALLFVSWDQVEGRAEEAYDKARSLTRVALANAEAQS